MRNGERGALVRAGSWDGISTPRVEWGNGYGIAHLQNSGDGILHRPEESEQGNN